MTREYIIPAAHIQQFITQIRLLNMVFPDRLIAHVEITPPGAGHEL